MDQKTRDAIRRRQAEQRLEEEMERRSRVDGGPAPEVSPPVGRVVQPGWRRRKPIIRGGAVIGYRKPGNTA